MIGGELASKGRALVFGPGRDPINFVSVRDVAALVTLFVSDGAPRGKVVEIGGPANLDFVARRRAAHRSQRQARHIKRIPLSVLRADVGPRQTVLSGVRGKPGRRWS